MQVTHTHPFNIHFIMNYTLKVKQQQQQQQQHFYKENMFAPQLSE